MSAALHAEGARPLKWGRVALHMGGGLLVVELLLADALPMTYQHFTYCIAALLVLIEVLRFTFPTFNSGVLQRVGIFAQSHEERRVTSATWFWLSMSFVCQFGITSVFVGTLVVLSVGDPAASVVGRAVRSPTLIHGRTLAGSAGFVLASTLAGFVYQTRLGVIEGAGLVVALAFASAVVGMVAELVSSKVDDNLTVGLSVGVVQLGAMLWLP